MFFKSKQFFESFLRKIVLTKSVHNCLSFSKIIALVIARKLIEIFIFNMRDPPVTCLTEVLERHRRI